LAAEPDVLRQRFADIGVYFLDEPDRYLRHLLTD